MKELLKDKKLYVFIGITVLFFGAYFFMQYAPDTYSVFTNSLRETVLHFISCGRIVTGGFIYLLRGILKLGYREVYLVSYGVAVICTVASMYKIHKLFCEDIKNDALGMIIAVLIVINPFCIELFLYIEKGILMLSVLLCILAVEQIKKWLEKDKRDKKDVISLLLALFYMIIANCCYQGTVGMFVAISLLYIIKYSKSVIEFIRNNVIVAVIYGLPAILNFIMVRFIFTNSRATGKIIITESIQKIIAGTRKMFLQTYELLPKYLFVAVILLLVAIIIYKVLRQEKTVKTKILGILGTLYLIAGATCVTIFPQVLQDTQSIWFVARSSYPVATIIGILLIYIATKFEIKPPMQQILIVACCAFLATQYVYFMKITKDNYIVGYQDKQIAEQVKQQIDEYETQTGKKVTKIALYRDKYPSYTYSQILATGDINVKAFNTEWSTMAIMKYYVTKDLEQVEKEKELEEKFAQANWEYYNSEQVVIKEDTIHLCIY